MTKGFVMPLRIKKAAFLAACAATEKHGAYDRSFLRLCCAEKSRKGTVI